MNNLIALLLFTIFINSRSNMPKDVKTEFEKIFDSNFKENNPGGVILVKKGDSTIFLKSYGVSNISTKEKITPNTIFNTGSISKTFVSNGILILQENNLLSVDDNLHTYFNDFENVEIAKKIKLKHLLTHTSGLPDSRKVSENTNFYITAKDKENFEPIKHTHKLNFDPGEKFEYSNPAFNGLALIIEKVTDKKWQSFIKENIFDLAGMQNSLITDGPFPQKGVAHAYTPVNGIFKEDDYGEYPTFPAAGNGGVWSTVLDLAKYQKAIQNNIFLSEELIHKSQNIVKFNSWNSIKNPDVGYSWFILEKDNPNNIFGVKIISHTGWQGGFRAFFISIPEKDILYIGLFNRPIKDLSESYNPFTQAKNNLTDVRVKGVSVLMKQNWLD